MAKTLVIKGANYSANKFDTVTLEDPIPCTSITLDKSSQTLTSLTAFTLVATVAPVDTTDVVEWSTSDSTVATVADGVVTPVGLGVATITATCGSCSATCAVTIDNVVANFVAVSGYNPYRRNTTSSATTVDKKTGEVSKLLIIADDRASGLYTIESKLDVDTSPYRFVPILIPANATKIKVNTTISNFKTRTLFFDSTKVQTDYNTGIGAYCVSGTTGTWDQGSTAAGPLTISIPQNISGLDSFCMGVNLTVDQTIFTDLTSLVTVVFSYGE